jgi:hypothetical protein
MALAFCLAGASTSIVYRLLGSLSRRLFFGDREDRQIHVHDKAQEYGNAADGRFFQPFHIGLPARPNARRRPQAREAESAISGIVRRTSTSCL